jgi:hypothetical protein
MLKIQSWGRLSILQEDCIQKNISVWGINISLRLIDLGERRVPICPFLKQLREKYYASNSILGPAVNPTGRLHPETHFIMFFDVLSVLYVLFVLLVLPYMFCGARNDRKPSFRTQNTHFIMFLNVLSVLSVLSVLCLFSLPAGKCQFGLKQ